MKLGCGHKVEAPFIEKTWFEMPSFLEVRHRVMKCCKCGMEIKKDTGHYASISGATCVDCHI